MKMLILGAAPCEFSREYLQEFLLSQRTERGGELSAAVLDASVLSREFSKHERELFGELPALSAQNLVQINLLYLRDANPYLLLARLHADGLLQLLRERILSGLAVVAAGGATLAMAPTLETAMCMPLAHWPSSQGLDVFGAGLQVGDLDEHKRAAFDEYFTLNPERAAFVIPARSGLLINAGAAQAKGSLIKLMAGFEQFFNTEDFIRLPALEA